MFNTVSDSNNINPIFSDYNYRDSNFNENMDEYVQAPYDLYIEEQKKKLKEEPKGNINKEAIDNIPEIPQWLEEEYKVEDNTPQWYKNLNVTTQGDIEEWKNKGKMGLVETLQKHNYWYSIPYAGTSAETTMAVRAANTLRRVKNGEQVSDVDMNILCDFLRDSKEMEVRGGHTWLGGAANILLDSFPYALEFAGGIAAIGADGIGFAALSKTLATMGAKKAASKAIKAEIKRLAVESTMTGVKKKITAATTKSIYNNALKELTKGGAKAETKAILNLGAKEVLKETAKATPKAIKSTLSAGRYFMPQQFVGNIADRQLATGVYVTDAGDAVFKDSENLAVSIYKAFGDTTFDALTETMGWTISPVANYFAKPLRKILPKKFFTGFEKIVSSRYGMPAAEALRKYGYDGIIEEMGEEALSRLLSQTFGINGLEDYNFDGFMKNIFYFDKEGKTGVEGLKTGLKNSAYGFSQEALSFGAMSMGGHALAGSASNISDIWKEKQYKKDVATLTNAANRYIQSPEQFYLEQGLFRIKGSQSLAEQKLRDIWTSKNIDEGLQDDVLKNMSETEIRNQLKDTIENESKDETPENAGERITRELTKKLIENKTFAKEKDAASVASLFSAPLQKLSEVAGLSLEEVMEDEMPNIQREAEAAQKENGRYIRTEAKIEELFDELNNLPDDFDNEDYVQKLTQDIDILTKIREGGLADSDMMRVENIINQLNSEGENEFADELRELVYNQTGQLYQDAALAGAKENEIEKAKKEWKEKGVESKYFKKWFYDSKVVDEEGKPLVVYHGTRDVFDTFDVNKKGKASDTARVGFWFSDRENFAENFARDIWWGEQEKPVVMPVYISMQNPKIYEKKNISKEELNAARDKVNEIENKIKELNQQFNKIVQETGSFYKATEAVEKPRELLKAELKEAKNVYAELRYSDPYEQLRTDIRKMEGGNAEDANFGGLGMVLKDPESVERFVDKLKEEGYDGIIIKGTHFDSEAAETDNNNQYAVFSPEQIKSVDNRGTFDSNNPNIFYQGENDDYYNLDGTSVVNPLNPLDYDYIHTQFENVPKEEQEKIKLEVNPELENRKDEIVKPKELKDTKLNLLRTKENDVKNIKSNIKQYLFGKGKTNTNVKNNNTSIIATIFSSNIDEMIHKANKINIKKEGAKEKRTEFYNIIANAKNLFESSEYVLSYNEAKKESLKDSQKIHRYANVVNSNNNQYIVIFTIQDNKNRNTIKIYDLENFEQKNSSGELVRPNGATPSRTNISIAQLTDFVKSRVVEKYNNDYKEAKNRNSENNLNLNVKEHEGKNLLMTHSARVEKLNDILDSGSLVAPSMAITKKGEKSLNFGGIVFVRNPKKINFNEDNIYDRDIYSPRLPLPDYETSDGYFVSSYDYESMERLWKNHPEKFKQNYGGKTFDEYFEGAKKVINLGFTPSGNRRTQPYNNQNLLNYIKKESLLSGENWDYGLSSLLAKLAKKQGSIEELKKTAKKGLKNSSEELDKQWQEIRKEFEELENKIKPYYSNEYVYLFEVMSDVVYSIEKNNKRKLSEYFDNPLPKEIVKEVKDFVKKAQKIPRAYFEAKPMKEVPLSDFNTVLVTDEVTKEQRQRLKDYGLEVIEYENGKLDAALNKVKSGEVYFQGAYTNYKEQLEDAIANREYKKFVNKVYNNKLPKKEQSNLFTIGKTPQKLIEAGIPQNNISIGVGVINKAKSNKNPDHNLSEATVGQVYTALKNPIAVIETLPDAKEKDKNKKYAVILDLQENDNYVMASVKVNQENKGVIINEIKTIHSREDYLPIIDKAFNEKRLLKVDRDKIKDLLNSKIHTELISDGVASLIESIYQLKNNVKFFNQTAWTGSPSDYDVPSLDFIGSGEGAAAHGWGLYYAQRKDVAEEYRERLSTTGTDKNRNIWTYEGKDYNLIFNDKKNKVEIENDNGLKDYEKDLLVKFFDGTGKAENEIYDDVWFEISDKIEELESREDNEDNQKQLDFCYKQREILENKGYPERKYKTKGQLFEVDIPEDDVLLDENKPFSEQSEKVQKAFKQLLDDRYFTDGSNKFNEFYELKQDLLQDIKDDMNGKFLYDVLARYSAETASKLLNKYGIKGITYEGQQDGRCYVIFDDKAVKIIEKYYQFVGEGSETANKFTLEEAKKRLKSGENAEKVRQETGWFKGVDGKFRYEISDKDAKINEDLYYRAIDKEKNMAEYDKNHLELNKKISEVREKRASLDDRLSELYAIIDKKGQGKEVAKASKEIAKLNKEYTEVENKLDKLNKQHQDLRADINSKIKGLWNMTLGDLLDHEKLYAAYPSIKNVRVEFRDLGDTIRGSYSEALDEILLSDKLWLSEVKEILLHEIQHYIQDVEGFAQGSNTKTVEKQLRKSLEKIIESPENVKYEELMDELSIVNKARLVHSIYLKPENITKSYWFLQKGKGWYAPKKTSKKARKQFMDECCQEFLSETIAEYKNEITKSYPRELKLDRYNSYLQKSKAELDKIAKSLGGKAERILVKVDNYNANKIKSALKNYEDSVSYSLTDLYHRVAGEVEARNTQNRRYLSDEERIEKSPSETSDVPENEQLVVFDDGTTAFSESNMEDDSDSAQSNLFYDNITPRKLRNMNIKGAFVPAENLIELFKNADESTIVHEFAHWWLTRLEKYALKSEELALDLEEVRKFVKNNGEPFTREQHEKFAVGFEAYIRNGSARSNRLKKIFEDFKNALIQIYDSIKQLVYREDGTEHSFTEADIENLNRLFERLLTTENERIKKTVFDRCDDINDRIKDIKANQEREMQELDELWKDNIAINNRKSDKKRKVQEYLNMAENAVNKVPKEVQEMKKRYKNVTLSILEAATGYSRQFIANPKNWEKVQSAYDGTDRITAGNGMLPEWREFYEDTGVSYDNEDIQGDDKLAQQAFDVMVEGKYDFNDMDEDAIGNFYGKFDYLYGKIKTLKGEEKENALEAIYSLFENIPSMPDEVVADIAQKLDEVNKVYEEGQKEDFNRKHYPNMPVVQQLQMYVTNKLHNLKVYDPEVRYRVRITKSHNLYKTIKQATSVNATKKIVRQINDYVISDLENQAKTILHKEIQKQIRVNSKLVKVGTISKGRFDWKTNTIFAELVEINKLKQKEALREYGAMIELDRAAAGEEREENDENPISTPEFKTDFQSNLRRKFLEYRSSKIRDLNLLATRSLLEDIMTLKFEGRRAKDAEELEKQLQKDNMKTDLAQRVRTLKGNKLGQAVAKFIMGETPLTSEKTLANWETSLNALFGQEVAQRYSLLKLESDAEVYAYKHYADFCQKAMEIYGLNNPVNAKEKIRDKFNRFVDFGNIQPLIKLMQEYEEEVYNFKETTFSKETGQFIETGVQLSRAEIITLYAWSLNEELEQRIMTQYGLAQVQYMFEGILSDEDKQFAWLLVDTCEAMYDENNEVFIRTTGLSLPKVQNYFPSKTVRVGSEIDMLHENIVRSSNPSFIKQRKTCNRIKMKPEQPISILLPHINKTARYVILSERMNYLNAIFKDATVRAAIKEVFDGVKMPESKTGERVKGKRNKQKRTVGDRIHDTLLNQLGSSTFENYVRGLNVGKSVWDVVASNYISSRIGGNFKVLFGQLTSVVNYAEKMPIGLWAKGFANVLKNPKETFTYMMNNCDYLKARLSGNSMNEVMVRITDETDRFRSLRNFCSTNTKYGDILAIIFGGKPYIDYLIDSGMTKEEAFEKFVEDTLRSQQSGHNSATSIWQKKMSENFFTRMMFAFNNTSLQYERKFLDAISAAAKREIDKKQLIKAILLYKVFNPIIFTSFLGNLSLMQLIGSLMRGDDDDAFAKFGIDVASAMAFANMGAYGFAGMGITTVLRFLVTLIDKNEYKPFLKTVPVIGDLEKIGKDLILKNEVTFSDLVESMALIGDDATGVPVSRITNTVGGFGDIAQGDYGVGLLKMLGYGNYRSHVAAEGKPPKK